MHFKSLRRCVSICFCLVCFCVLPEAAAQVRGFNLFEFQAGNTPFTDPSDLTTGFDQLNVSYVAGRLAGQVRVEQFFGGSQDYQQLSQYRFSFRDKGAEVTVGHFYDIIGRGLLLRSFEIPGVVFESPSSRVRQGFYRDILGVKFGYQTSKYAIKAIRGKPLLNVIPATQPISERRSDLIEAVEANVNLGPVSVGSAFMRSTSDDRYSEYASASISAELPLDVSGFVELAREVGNGHNLLALKAENPFAFYGSLTYARASFGVSAEYKNYNNFFLGAGYNDPPSLVKEHQYAVLNRTTHVLNVVDEQGLQIEVFYRLDGGVVLTANVTRAENDFSTRFVFYEYFIELVLPLNEKTNTKVFADYAADDSRFEEDRYSFGGYVERRLSGRWSASADVEAQKLSLRLGDGFDVRNYVLAFTISNSTRYSVGIVLERSTDPFLTDNQRTPDIAEMDPRNWLGASFAYRPNRNHSIALFTGSRRGGPACTSGICYEVLDFRGAELRITTRF